MTSVLYAKFPAILTIINQHIFRTYDLSGDRQLRTDHCKASCLEMFAIKCFNASKHMSEQRRPHTTQASVKEI